MRSEPYVIRPLAALAVCGLFLLGACSPAANKAGSDDPNAGLDAQILDWRTALEATHPACAGKVDGKGCDSFQVTCKAMQEITPDEKAKGITAQIVASMSFNGRGADGAGRPGSAFALFSKAGGVWTRVESPPINMSTCASM